MITSSRTIVCLNICCLISFFFLLLLSLHVKIVREEREEKSERESERERHKVIFNFSLIVSWRVCVCVCVLKENGVSIVILDEHFSRRREERTIIILIIISTRLQRVDIHLHWGFLYLLINRNCPSEMQFLSSLNIRYIHVHTT